MTMTTRDSAPDSAPDSDSDNLARLLRRDAQGMLADEGFTSRVLASLPSRAHSTHHAWLASALVLGSAALGSALALVFAPAGSNIVQGFFDIAHARANTPAALAGFAMAGALVLSAIVLALDAE